MTTTTTSPKLPDRTASGQDMFQPRSLVEILSFLRDLHVDPARVRSQDIGLIYSAMFGMAWADPETEQHRTDFLSKVGPESARHLCRYVLHHHPEGRFGDGFTDDDLELVLCPLTIAVAMVLLHPELAPEGFSCELAITTAGKLSGRRLRKLTGLPSMDKEARH